MDYHDYYKTLGVARGASTAEIKKAFRKLAREHHPDRNPGNKAAEQRFKEVNEAHAVLSDPEKRKQFDMLGANWDQFQRAGGGRGGAGDPFGPGGPFADFARRSGAGGAGGQNVRYEFHTTGAGDAGFSDFFRTFFSGGAEGAAPATGRRSRTSTASGPSFQDILAGMGISGDGDGERRGRAGTTQAPEPRELPEIEAPAELSLEEAYHGTSRLVEIEGKRYEVQIPRGADTGSRIRLRGKGPNGRDVVVTTRIRPHPVYTRRGADLERELPITLREAMLGAEIPVTTLKGRILLTVPAGTQNGRTFRLSGQGMPAIKGGATGSLLVKIRVVLPTGLEDEAKAAAGRFLDLVDQPDPRATT